MARASNSDKKDIFWHAFSIALFIIIVGVVIGHILQSFKETFVDLTSEDIDRDMLTSIDRIECDEKNKYKDIFFENVPTFMKNRCSPECCHDNNELSCSRGCVCLSKEDKQQIRGGQSI